MAMTHNLVRALGGLALTILVASACTPTVRVEVPREPITINLNIKIDANVRLKLEESARSDIKNNPEIF
jgi:hypothetical protein